MSDSGLIYCCLILFAISICLKKLINRVVVKIYNHPTIRIIMLDFLTSINDHLLVETRSVIICLFVCTFVCLLVVEVWPLGFFLELFADCREEVAWFTNASK